MAVLGCAGVADLAARLSEKHGLPVIGGVASAVKLAEAFVTLGLRTSKIGSYAGPRPKPFRIVRILRAALEILSYPLKDRSRVRRFADHALRIVGSPD
jgi:hypothetical protein